MVSRNGRICVGLPDVNERVSLVLSLPFSTQQSIPVKRTTVLGELCSHRQSMRPCIYKYGAWAHLLTSLGKVSHVYVMRLGSDSESCRGVGTAQRLNWAILRLRTSFFLFNSSNASGSHFWNPCKESCLYVYRCYQMLEFGISENN